MSRQFMRDLLKELWEKASRLSKIEEGMKDMGRDIAMNWDEDTQTWQGLHYDNGDWHMMIGGEKDLVRLIERLRERKITWDIVHGKNRGSSMQEGTHAE